VPTAIDNRARATLQAVFGDRVPADGTGALRMLAESPFAPTNPIELQALRALVLERAAQSLEELRGFNPDLAKQLAPPTTSQRAMPANMALLMQSVQAARTAQVDAGLQQAVSPDRARELFDQLAHAPDIPHDFVDEGCHYRAHVEAQRLEQQGVYSEKIFMVPDGADLRINSSKSPIGFTLAMFHTAPCINVEQPDDTTQRMVIDPSLFDQPVSVDQWQSAMYGLNRKPCHTYFLPRHAFHISDRDQPPATWRQKDLDEALAWNSEYKALQDDMKQSGFYDSLKEMAAAEVKP